MRWLRRRPKHRHNFKRIGYGGAGWSLVEPPRSVAVSRGVFDFDPAEETPVLCVLTIHQQIHRRPHVAADVPPMSANSPSQIVGGRLEAREPVHHRPNDPRCVNSARRETKSRGSALPGSVSRFAAGF